MYNQLVTDRLAGLVPASLTQTDIAQRYGVDRVTMTRALSRLSEDGLIARNKGHGWSFQPSLDSALTQNAVLHRLQNPRLHDDQLRHAVI